MSLQTSSILPHRVAVSHRSSQAQKWNSRGARPAKRAKRTTASPSSRPSIRVATGRAGDHLSVHPFLLSLLHGPSETEFQLNLDRPSYDAAQRLLLWRGDDLIGHIRLTPRLLRFNGTWLPTCDLSEFALLPEYASDEHRVQLLTAAEEHAVDLGAVLLTSRTHGADVSQNSSWVANGDVWCSGVSPRDLLANCAARAHECPRTSSLQVRPWRYVEQQALADIYEWNTRGCAGAPMREEEYWHWLLIRRGYDEVLVATTKSDAAKVREDGDCDDEIVGYAFVRGSDIVELMVAPEWPHAALRLVQRVAADAIERDDHRVRIFQPPVDNAMTSRIQRLLRSDSAELQSAQSVQAVYVVDPPALVDAVCHQLDAATVSHFAGTKLGLKLNGTTLIIEPRSRRSLRVVRGKTARSQIVASQADVSRLLLGDAFASGIRSEGLRFASAATREFAQQLFQPVRLWRSTLDDLPSSN